MVKYINLKILIFFFILVLIFFSACSNTIKQNKTISKINLNINGEQKIINLSRNASLPLQKKDAILIKQESNCLCDGEIVLKKGFWIVSCCENIHDCLFKINQKTGEASCLYFG